MQSCRAARPLRLLRNHLHHDQQTPGAAVESESCFHINDSTCTTEFPRLVHVLMPYGFRREWHDGSRAFSTTIIVAEQWKLDRV
nr:hypothetical protein CFP56_48755 [Quercus suber]